MCFLLDLLQSGKDLQLDLRKIISASDKNIWNVKGLLKSWEQLYEHYCYNSVKSINVSHNIESKHASVWTMNDNSKLQYVLTFPDITETNGCGHSQQNIA